MCQFTQTNLCENQRTAFAQNRTFIFAFSCHRSLHILDAGVLGAHQGQDALLVVQGAAARVDRVRVRNNSGQKGECDRVWGRETKRLSLYPPSSSFIRAFRVESRFSHWSQWSHCFISWHLSALNTFALNKGCISVWGGLSPHNPRSDEWLRLIQCDADN